jgi:MFS transporter, DHA1 family, multidrug resistance protein
MHVCPFISSNHFPSQSTYITRSTHVVFEALPIIFIEKRSFTLSQDGLVFVGVSIGCIVGAIINILLSHKYPEEMKKWKGFPPPEHRLYGAMAGGPILAIGSFWLGWTGEYSNIIWYVPAISTILLGMSVSLTFISFLVRLFISRHNLLERLLV